MSKACFNNKGQALVLKVVYILKTFKAESFLSVA